MRSFHGNDVTKELSYSGSEQNFTVHNYIFENLNTYKQIIVTDLAGNKTIYNK